jgi:hypothetical protein
LRKNWRASLFVSASLYTFSFSKWSSRKFNIGKIPSAVGAHKFEIVIPNTNNALTYSFVLFCPNYLNNCK